MAASGGKVQIVFLIDVSSKRDVSSTRDLQDLHKLKCDAISLSVLRSLLHLNSALFADNLNGVENISPRLVWGYKFFHSNSLNYEYKRRRFYDLDVESFERFQQELHNCIDNEICTKKQNCSKAKSMSCSFADILHDFEWVSPDISSPFKRTRRASRAGEVKMSRKAENYLLMYSECPLSNSELQDFVGGKASYQKQDGLINEIFSPALRKEFTTTCKLALYWVDTGWWCLAPDKITTTNMDWDVYELLRTTTKQLGGNLIPISYLTHNRPPCIRPDFQKSSTDLVTMEKKDQHVDCNINNNIVKIFHFSYGAVLHDFLKGNNVINLDNTYASKVTKLPKTDPYQGWISYDGSHICRVLLSPINVQGSHPCNTGRKSILNTNIICDTEDKETTTDDVHGTRGGFDESTNMTVICGSSEENKVNLFQIKGVIGQRDVVPAWLHPTKLFTCAPHNGLPHEVIDTNLGKTSLESLQQLLHMISKEGLNLVIEFYEPDSCSVVIGLLQPITSVCGVVSIVLNDRSIELQKVLLGQTKYGYILVPCDITAQTSDGATTLPLKLRKAPSLKDSTLVDGKEPISIKQSQKASWEKREKSRQQEKRGVVCGKDLFLKLKEYYTEKQKHKRENKNVNNESRQILTRGKLCQDTAKENKACESSENKVELRSEGVKEVKKCDNKDIIKEKEGMEVKTFLSSIKDIETIDELRSCLKEEYERCINLNQCAATFSNHALGSMQQFRASGKLKDTEHVIAFLKSCILFDSKELREIQGMRGENTDRDRIVQEYKIQVFLRLELADKPDILNMNEEQISDEITAMLRAISFQKDPTYLKSFMKNAIISRYAGRLSKLLCLVYDGLMQKPPKEILSPSRVSSEEDTPLKSRKNPSVSSRSESMEEPKNSRSLVRRHSVMEIPSRRREIVIPIKGKTGRGGIHRNKKKQSKSSGKKNTKAPIKVVTPVKKVRKNLFAEENSERRTSPRKHGNVSGKHLSRRHSVAAFSHSKKVADTPVGKQVASRMLRRQEWQRRRSKTVIDRTVVGESPVKIEETVRPFPRKSPRRRAATFYSGSQINSKTSGSTTKTVDTASVVPEQSNVTSHATGTTVTRKFKRALSLVDNASSHSSTRNIRRSSSMKDCCVPVAENDHNETLTDSVFFESAMTELDAAQNDKLGIGKTEHFSTSPDLFNSPAKTSSVDEVQINSTPVKSNPATPGTSPRAEHGTKEIHTAAGDESVVRATPQLCRRRSLLAKPKLLQGSLEMKMTDKNVDTTISTAQEAAAFTSPVATKRKVMTSKGEHVSPLNQMLKQRKNSRNSPGTSNEARPKSKRLRRKHDFTSDNTSQSREENICEVNPNPSSNENLTAETYPLSDGALNNENSSKNRTTLDSSPCGSPTDSGSPDKRVSVNDNLGRQFSPKPLSAASLKHLTESPVLISSTSAKLRSKCTPQKTRKWSERLSPRETASKRLRQDV